MGVGHSILIARKHLGLSQRAFAERAGVGQNLVVRAEKDGDIRLSTLRKLSLAGEVDLMLIPRALVPAVRALLIAHESGKSIAKALDEPMYAVDFDEDSD